MANEETSTKIRTEEYLMLRQEILQYIQNYHNVKHVMYSICAGIFTFLFTKDNVITEPLAYLCPLLVVIPAYLTAVNLWLSVSTDAAYLMVFHEEEGSTFQWETKYNNLCKTEKYTHLYGGKIFATLNMNMQLLPYIMMSVISMLIYFWKIFTENYSSSMFSYCVYLIIGLCLIMVLIFLFVTYSSDKKNEIIKAWRALKDAKE